MQLEIASGAAYKTAVEERDAVDGIVKLIEGLRGMVVLAKEGRGFNTIRAALGELDNYLDSAAADVRFTQRDLDNAIARYEQRHLREGLEAR